MILVIALIAVLAGSLALLAALHTRAFIALALADLRQNAGLGAASLESLQSAFQTLIFSDDYLCHTSTHLLTNLNVKLVSLSLITGLLYYF